MNDSLKVTQIRNYKKIESIGNGSFGAVYKVENILDKKIYALKVLLLNESYLLPEENPILCKLKNPNLLVHIESFKEGFNYCIITEYCSGGDLRRKIENSKQLQPSINLNLILIWSFEIINALDALHSNEIIHRDIKPENILLNEDNHVKVCDFGISKLFDSDASYASTIIGTRDYMSPEATIGQSYSYKTDIWAAGCVIFELIVLKRLKQFINDSKENYSLLKKNIPVNLFKLLKMMIVIDPKSRADSKNLIELIFSINGLQKNIQNQENLLFVLEVMKKFPTSSHSEENDYTKPNVADNRKSKEEIFDKLDQRQTTTPESTSTIMRFDPTSSILKIDTSKPTKTKKKKRLIISLSLIGILLLIGLIVGLAVGLGMNSNPSSKSTSSNNQNMPSSTRSSNQNNPCFPNPCKNNDICQINGTGFKCT